MAEKTEKPAAAEKAAKKTEEAVTPAVESPVAAKKFDFTSLNSLAVVSLATALTSVGAVAAVITGHIALAQIKKSGAAGRALAIAGLVVGYATIAFWAFSSLVWMGLMFKGFGGGYGMMGWDSFFTDGYGPGMMGNR